MYATPLFCRELLRHITLLQISSILGGFHIISTGDLTSAITELFKASTSPRQQLSTEKSRSFNGEEAMISHHPLSTSMTRGIQDLPHSTPTCQQMLSHALNPSRLQSIESSPSGTTPFAQPSWTIRMSSWLPMETP